MRNGSADSRPSAFTFNRWAYPDNNNPYRYDRAANLMEAYAINA